MLRLIEPAICELCQAPLREQTRFVLCTACLAKLPFQYLRRQEILLKEGGHQLRVHTVFLYEAKIRQLILKLKFGQRPRIAEDLALFAAHLIVKNQLSFQGIVPLPLSPKRERERGYNQAGKIAQKLAQILDLPYLDNFLYRSHSGQRQALLKTKAERIDNVKNSFSYRPLYPSNFYLGKKLVLVDDVITTGASLSSASQVLSQRGYKVEALAIASERRNASILEL